ncbi:hypothetical protein D3C80_932950 [compost metagenome]
MMALASSRVNGSTSFLERAGSWMASAGFRVINPSSTAERRMVDSLTIALRFTDGDVQLIDATIRRSRVEVIRSMRTRARCGTQYKFRVPL